MKDGSDAQRIIKDHTDRAEETSNALKALTAKLVEEPSPTELNYKQEQLRLNQAFFENEKKTKNLKVELDKEKYLSDKKIKEELLEIKKSRITAEINKTKIDATMLKLKQLNADKDKAYERLARYEHNQVLCTRIIKEIESLDDRIKSFYNSW